MLKMENWYLSCKFLYCFVCKECSQHNKSQKTGKHCSSQPAVVMGNEGNRSRLFNSARVW